MTVHFMDTELIHYNDEVFKNPHPLCPALSVLGDGMEEEKEEAYVFLFKINSQLAICWWVIFKPRGHCDCVFLFSNCSRY